VDLVQVEEDDEKGLRIAPPRIGASDRMFAIRDDLEEAWLTEFSLVEDRGLSTAGDTVVAVEDDDEGLRERAERSISSATD